MYIKHYGFGKLDNSIQQTKPGSLSRSFLRILSGLVVGLLPAFIWSQIPSGVYSGIEPLSSGDRHYEVKISGDYLVQVIYDSNPAHFISTKGGFFTVEDDILHWQLEFNSGFETDSTRSLSIPVKYRNNILNWEEEGFPPLSAQPSLEQPLDGLWLFATRGPDTEQERRGEENTRKTLKFLWDGHFQWIAYDTESMRFSGTGGGSYTAEDGVYIENIGFFSRDNDRVGAQLEFQYELQGTDWHHTGKNSRGEPLYEIWAKRSIRSQ